MSNQTRRVASYGFRGLALIVAAIALANWLITERFFLLFSPRLLWQFILAIAILIVLAWGYQTGRATNSTPNIDNSKPLGVHYILLALLPFAIVTFMNVPIELSPTVSLDSVMISAAPLLNQTLEADTLDRNVMDWSQVISLHSDARALDGMAADVIGVAYHDPNLTPDQILLTRQRVSDTVYYGQSIAVVAEVSEGHKIRDGSWIRLIGQFEAGNVAGTEIPILVASESHLVQQPELPFLYP